MIKKIKDIMSKKDKTKKDETVNEELENEQATAEMEAPEEGDERDPLVELEQERNELKDKYLRLFAEFDNYKKRTVKERLDLMRTAAQDTLSALLPVLDDFDRAKKNAESENTEETLSEGVLLAYNKLYNTLKQRGLTPMESTGVVFDAELHEAITEIPAPSEDMKGKVIDTIEKGYFLNDKIIRYAKVVVGK